MLAFLGVAPGMTALDMNAATGWYTEILAGAVEPAGRVIAHNHPGARTALPAAAFEARYGKNRLPNVEQIFVRHDDLHLPSCTLDVVLMSLVYHDLYWRDDTVDWGPIDREALLESLLAALKPGGVVGVVDHCAAVGRDPFESAVAVHRIDPRIVRRDFIGAGFEPAGESDILRNRADDYSLSVFDAAVVGCTDRFVLRFRKPPAPGVR